MSEIAIGAGAGGPLASLRAETRLRLPNCCVLVTAEREAGALATFDESLGDAARRRGVEVV